MSVHRIQNNRLPVKRDPHRILLPLLVAALAPNALLVWWVGLSSLVFLAALGAMAARAGGAGVLRSAWRVTFWGALAMGITAVVGRLFGAVV